MMITSTVEPTPQSDGIDLAVITGGAAGGVPLLIAVIVFIIILVCCCVIIRKRNGMGATQIFLHKIFNYFIEKSNASLRKEMPEPFNNNITYIPPEVLDSSVKVKHSGSHYAKGMNLTNGHPQPPQGHIGIPLPKLPAGTNDMTYDKLETAESNYATPNYTVYY